MPNVRWVMSSLAFARPMTGTNSIAEKKLAFAALADQIDRILHPQDNVIPFGASR